MALPFGGRTHRNGLIGTTGPRWRHRGADRNREHANSLCEMVDSLRTQNRRVRRRADITLHTERVLPIGHSIVRTRSERGHMGSFLSDDVVDDLAIVVHVRMLLNIPLAEHDIARVEGTNQCAAISAVARLQKKRKGSSFLFYFFIFVFRIYF